MKEVFDTVRGWESQNLEVVVEQEGEEMCEEWR